MLSILFGFEIIAFLVVAWWVYLRADAGEDAAETGLLGMRSSTRVRAGAAPKWKAAPRGDARAVPSASKALAVSRAGPRWRGVEHRPGGRP
ncbi:hypothetical protein PMI01_02160 [Caulobacter sp. AP07]|uniref:hypothetical protein n=1 Tax=Caulobacter sp. AP07 TaxID=1144304 RepID=UPI0002721B0D|nr:hypothetical protein [Caulobacter sp. AP07]EJL33360.1 hypothetical protein PMI01_02160 [Caulobacter sp. AP07]